MYGMITLYMVFTCMTGNSKQALIVGNALR